jgi:uncharacterized protein (DUF779 family)
MIRIGITPRAAAVVAQIRQERSGSLSFTIDGGCCEGTAPHLLVDAIITPAARQIGEVAGVPVYLQSALAGITAAMFTIDVVEEPLSDAMSLETEQGLRFVLREG